MKSPSFQIELLGGPADGLQMAADKIPDRTIRMPSSLSPHLSDGCGRRRATARYWAEYELLWRKYDLDSRGAAVVRLGYDFVAFRAGRNPSATRRFAAGLLRITGLAWLATCTGGWRNKLATRRLATRWLAARWLAARKKTPAGYPIEKHDTRSAAAIPKRQRLRHP
jgi:hypothetical protein